ncbi:MAG: (E)-4-hydroxy-3-methylbut-2-enyl-diphosphate synthase [Bacteroidales bacterium]|nr:(E)-4-hydroxy-3-methylbut-2-enyl-diphosphate synthase [Bacteroidales bacterium]
MSRYNYVRRPSREVRIGGLKIGGENAVRVQSMTNRNTNDVEACVEQSLRIADAGGELVRLTTQGVKEATNIGLVREALRERGCEVPIVADVHFNPKAAFKAATTCDKVRINPGNFVDAARTFKKLTFTDEEYAGELDRIRRSLIPFLDLCRENGTAIRLGVNHGSLSDRIMSRYGDTPAGMTESVMEYLRICREADFHNIVISIKASNTAVMVETVRTLVAAMDEEDMHYPLHLGVTEAGDGEDGRIKSAVGIGTLLAEGLGDTIRVSLSEEPEAEIPVAKALVEHICTRGGHKPVVEPAQGEVPELRVQKVVAATADYPELPCDWREIDAASEVMPTDDAPVILTSSNLNAPGEMLSFIVRYRQNGGKAPVIVKLTYADADVADVQLKAAADFGTLLLNGYADGILLDAPALTREQIAATELAILQAARLRFTKTEYIACPGCGRTLFDLQGTLKAVKEATAHLPGVKIGVMGCIVNGPGEMADADYGYVGAAAGRVSLYRGKECVEKNIPQEEAIGRLLALIAADTK